MGPTLHACGSVRVCYVYPLNPRSCLGWARSFHPDLRLAGQRVRQPQPPDMGAWASWETD